MREALLTCPGCNRKYPYARLELVSIQVQPGKQGGKKFKVRYCQQCISSVRVRSGKLEEAQTKEWDRAKGAQKEFMRDVRGR